MYRRAHARLLFVGFCLVALTGPAAARDKERSPFAGTFTGEWTFKSSNVLFPDNQKGKLTLTVAANGKVTGHLENLTLKKKAKVKGSINGDGELDVTVEFSGQAFTLKGTMTKTKRGNLKGTVDQYYSKGYPVGTIELDLPPKAAAAAPRPSGASRRDEP